MVGAVRWFALLLMGAGVLFGQTAELLREAVAAQKRGDYERAAEVYRRALELAPGRARLRSNLGLMLYLQGKDQEALGQFRQALRDEPNLTAAHLFTGLALLRRQRPREALPHLTRARRSDPQDLIATLAAARANVALQQYAEANELYHTATQVDPENAEAWFGLGVTYRNLLDHAMVRMAGANAGVAPERILIERAGRERAHSELAALQSKAAKAPDDSQALAELARAYQALAVQALGRAVALDPESARSHLLLAESYREANDLLEAVREYEKAIAIEPKLAAAHLGLATTYWKEGDRDEALPPLRRTLELSPRDPQANAIMADLLAGENRCVAARPYADSALAGDPNLHLAQYVLARCEFIEGQTEEAAALLEGIVRHDLSGAYSYLQFQVLRKLGRHDEAQEALRRFRKLRGSSHPAAGDGH